eukprot:7696248-Prorocentrum_lima.AAC.1
MTCADTRDLPEEEGKGSNAKKNIHWYCGGCGKRYNQGVHSAHCLLVIVPPKKASTSTTDDIE